VTCATSVLILVFLGLSVLELRPMYATGRRQTDVRQKHRLMLPPYGGGGIINCNAVDCHSRSRVPAEAITIQQRRSPRIVWGSEPEFRRISRTQLRPCLILQTPENSHVTIAYAQSTQQKETFGGHR